MDRPVHITFPPDVPPTNMLKRTTSAYSQKYQPPSPNPRSRSVSHMSSSIFSWQTSSSSSCSSRIALIRQSFKFHRFIFSLVSQSLSLSRPDSGPQESQTWIGYIKRIESPEKLSIYRRNGRDYNSRLLTKLHYNSAYNSNKYHNLDRKAPSAILQAC